MMQYDIHCDYIILDGNIDIYENKNKLKEWIDLINQFIYE
jgi:hypothetical protein